MCANGQSRQLLLPSIQWKTLIETRTTLRSHFNVSIPPKNQVLQYVQHTTESSEGVLRPFPVPRSRIHRQTHAKSITATFFSLQETESQSKKETMVRASIPFHLDLAGLAGWCPRRRLESTRKFRQPLYTHRTYTCLLCT